MDLKRLLDYRKVLVPLFVVVANLVVFAFLWRLDGFIHSDLYDLGLIFNLEWASEYWSYNQMVQAFLGAATLLATVSMILHYMRRVTPSRFAKYAGFLLPVLALIFQASAIVNLNQINSLVWNRLYAYGVQYDIDWSATYNPISMPALALMAAALLVLILTAIAALNIIEIEIVYEDENLDIEKANEPQETVIPPPKEEQKREQPISSQAKPEISSQTKPEDSELKPATEKNMPKTKKQSVSRKHETVKKPRKRRKAKKRRKPRAPPKVA